MIHKIKALYDEGRGSSIRTIARELGLSRNTVRRYLRADVASIEAALSDRSRDKALDEHRGFLKHQLEHYPRLSAVKLRRRLEDQIGPVSVGTRSFRRYVNGLREQVCQAQPRYYEPVLDGVPGVQCQVDAGELRGVSIGGTSVTVYFVVFVLSWSRMMYVGLSRRAFDTERFIALHDEALRYFGGCPQECVYDQTRLVVLDEQYRELELNERFARYASAAGFAIRVCEGYDPESKGKVEAGVKYVKGDGLYGEDFEDWSALAAHLRDWLECVANVRVHGTTGEIPKLRFDSREQAALKPYLSPACLRAPHTEGVLRKVDKTGLLSFQGNRYSAPLAFQRGRVRVVATPDGQLRLHHADTGELVATHPLHPGKGALVKNGDHYRDKAKARAELEAELEAALGHELGQALCAQLRQRDRAYYLDKLRGARRYLPRLQRLPPALLQGLLARPGGLGIRQMSEYLDAFEAHPERALRLFSEPRNAAAVKRTESTLLSAYRTLTGTEQEGGHELH